MTRFILLLCKNVCRPHASCLTCEFLPLLLAADVGVDGVDDLLDESLDFLLGGLSLSLSLSLSSVGVPFLFVGVDELLFDSD